MKNIVLYFKRNFYFMISLISLVLTISFAIVVFAVLDLSKDVESTSVGFIYLGSYEEKQYTNILAPRITSWQKTSDYEVKYQEYSWTIDLELFEFDLTRTINSVVSDQNNKAYFILSEENENELYLDLTEHMSDDLVEGFLFDEFVLDLTSDLELLKNRKTYDIKNYLTTELSQSVIDTVIIDDIPEDLITEFNELNMSELVIPANMRFQLLEAFKYITVSNESLSIIASALQYLLVKTPVEGFIFQPHTDLPVWANKGMNVRILKINQYDFSFFNPLKENMVLEIEQKDADSIEFTLKGYPFLTTYEREVVLGPTIYRQTTYIDNPTLNAATPGIVVSETDTETIYTLTIVEGLDGFVTYYKRVVTPLDDDQTSVTLYFEQTLPVDETKEEHRVEKE